MSKDMFQLFAEVVSVNFVLDWDYVSFAHSGRRFRDLLRKVVFNRDLDLLGLLV